MRRLYDELTAMPLILRLTVVASFGTGAALLVATLFRVGTFQIYDDTLSGAQLWSEGYGPFLVIAGLLMVSAGVGTFKGREWSRWLVVPFPRKRRGRFVARSRRCGRGASRGVFGRRLSCLRVPVKVHVSRGRLVIEADRDQAPQDEVLSRVAQVTEAGLSKRDLDALIRSLKRDRID